MRVRLLGSASGSDRTLAEEPAALIGHGGVCEGGEALRLSPVGPPLLGRDSCHNCYRPTGTYHQSISITD
jgi:hypothetical protein